MGTRFSFDVTSDDVGTRLDHFLVLKLSQFTRARLQALIKEGFVLLDSQKASPAQKLKVGQHIQIQVPEARESDPQGQVVPFSIVYEDNDIIVVNKPAGLVVHPGAGNPDRTLVNGLIAHCGASLSGIGGVKRPGIVHRLDKGTSGLMVVAKNDGAHQVLSAQFSNRSLKRFYKALCWGAFQTLKGTIEGNIGRDPRHRQRMKMLIQGGKTAVTHYRMIEKFGTYASHVECRLETGRTHQIRVHLSSIQHGLIGDPLYGRVPRGLSPAVRQTLFELTDQFQRPCLHAFHIEFLHPSTSKPMAFSIPWPEDLERVLEYLTAL
jgi:23S rRNA pseudouridine1911/1915/1917 synthase